MVPCVYAWPRTRSRRRFRPPGGELDRMAVASPTVSVILPTCQRRELARRAAASVLAQTHRDFELIVIDDGSTDGTRELFEPLEAELDGRLRYRWQPNRGVAAARNVALKAARGEVVAFLDSDNRWLPNHLAVIAEVFAQQPEAVVVSTCPDLVLRGRQPAERAALVDYRHGALSAARAVGTMSCIGVRREALAAAGNFDERLEALEDSDLIRRLALLGPFARVRSHTVVVQQTAGGLRDRSQRSGSYLAAAEISARNLVAAVERRPDQQRRALAPQAKGEEHLARAMRALDRGDRELLRAELEQACAGIPLLEDPWILAHRVRLHQPRYDRSVERLGMLELLTESLPPESNASRSMRAWAIVVASRLGRFGRALRLASGWRLRGTLGFVRAVAPLLRLVIRWRLQARGHRATETAAITGSAAPEGG